MSDSDSDSDSYRFMHVVKYLLRTKEDQLTDRQKAEKEELLREFAMYIMGYKQRVTPPQL